ncbi:MAG TPA: adenylate/guanylate cyclase domain-containing protein [Candidatus Limnocylindria bacterium]|nr:adenylate/guanylate cyclase domain-containing protein [Candidatus Limnocylindria bacterium]
MPTIPSGTVTFAFTDIEGSTALLKRLGDRYADVLAQHRRILRGAFEARDGQEIDTQGDAFFFSFPRARQAVAAAVEAQRALAEAQWPDGVEVRVRMGLHTGEPLVGEEGYTGLDVVRAARIAGSGRGGQVLLSETTRALVGTNLPDGVSVRALGAQRLKDLDEPEPIYELVVPGLTPEAEAAPAPRPAAPDVPPDAPEAGFLGDFTRTLREELRRAATDADSDPDLEGSSFGAALSRQILGDVSRSIVERTRDAARRRDRGDR